MKHRFLAKKYWKSITTPMAEVMELAKKYDDVINLSLGDPDYITDDKIIEAAFIDAKAGHTRYTDAAGYEELIDEITKYYNKKYGVKYEDNEIMAVVGACHGMFLVLQAIVDEGDEIIVHEPYFTPYKEQIDLVKGKTVILETCEEEDFAINAEKLKALINERTKAIIINSPNNPTGACFSEKVLKEISEIAIENDLVVISDEVYDAFSFKEPFMPIAQLPGMKERTIALCSFSKDFAMTGWRIGYVAAPAFIIDTIKDINEGICFTAPSISQRAAIHALKMIEVVQPPIVEEYKKRVLYAYERINAIPWLSVMEPQGSIYLFVNIKKTGLTSIEFCTKLLEEAHVLAIPGIAFGSSGEGYIRIACTVDMDKLKNAFDRIENIAYDCSNSRSLH